MCPMDTTNFSDADKILISISKSDWACKGNKGLLNQLKVELLSGVVDPYNWEWSIFATSNPNQYFFYSVMHYAPENVDAAYVL